MLDRFRAVICPFGRRLISSGWGLGLYAFIVLKSLPWLSRAKSAVHYTSPDHVQMFKKYAVLAKRRIVVKLPRLRATEGMVQFRFGWMLGRPITTRL